MRRRDFVSILCSSVATWSLAARAQPAAMQVVGILATASPDSNAARLRAFREGLQTSGYVEGQNVKINYSWAEEDSGRLPELAAQFVRQRVTVLVSAGGTASALAAKTATTSIPIIFGIAGDPVALGLVTSLNRPGGNVSGITSLNLEVTPKKLQLLHELLPSATVMGLLVNPSVADLAEPAIRLSQDAARASGVQLHVLRVTGEHELDAVFATAKNLHAGALAIAPDNLFSAHSDELAALSLHYALPSVYQFHRFVAAGGLMSYGSSETEYYRLVGDYTGRVLKGAKPADLPVQQSTVVQLLINLKTAKALGITVPISLLGRADEVIE